MAFAELELALTREQLAIRQEIANGNGVNMFFPNARDFVYRPNERFPSYDGIAVRIFGYSVNPVKACAYGFIGSSNGYVLIEIGQKRKPVVIKKSDGSSVREEEDGTNVYADGQTYLFGVRAAFDEQSGKNKLYAIDKDQVIGSHAVAIAKLLYYELCTKPGTHVVLSQHFGDYEPAMFPFDTGLDPVIAGVVRMELGSFAVYEGEYTGSDEINIVALNSMPSLGKPASSDVVVKIGIRKNLKMYVFTTDYGSPTVAAPFKDLVKKGHYYVPRFSSNFSIRNAQIQIYY